MPAMLKPFEVFVGLRYVRAKRRNYFISFISMISILGIAVGVTALITVLSVMNGFEKELKDRILGMASHATVITYGGTLNDWRTVEEKVAKQPGIVGVAPYIQAEGMLVNNRHVNGTVIRGILPEQEPNVSTIAQKMLFGSLAQLRPGGYGIIIGSELARSLGVLTGDKVTLVAPEANMTPAGLLPRLKRFTVVGIFDIGFIEADAGLALINLQDAQRLYQMGDAVSGVRLKLDDLFAAREVASELNARLGPDIYAADWTQSHANFFRAVEIEKRVMFIILLLIVAVAAFNVVSALVMLVTDKQADIAILRTLGASPGSVMQVFMVQGAVIGVIGTLLGVVCGVLLAINVPTVVPAIEHAFNVQFLSKSVYLIPELPSDVHLRDVVIIGLVSLVLSFIATLYPSWRASRVNPAEALRYE
jgi:lipoprotein-releasing system permease protein